MSRLLDFSSPGMHRNHIFRSFALDPTGWAYSAPTNTLAGGEGACCPSPRTPPGPSSQPIGPSTSAFRASVQTAAWLDPQPQSSPTKLAVLDPPRSLTEWRRRWACQVQSDRSMSAKCNYYVRKMVLKSVTFHWNLVLKFLLSSLTTPLPFTSKRPRHTIHRHHAIAPAAEAPIVFRTYQRRGMNRHEIGVKILGGEGSRPCRSPPTPQPWTWLGYGYTITCPRALHCPAAAAHGQCLAITGNAAPSINQSIVPRCTRRRAVPLQTRGTGDARLTPAPPVAALITRKPAGASAGVTKLLLLYLLFTNTQLYFHHKMW